MVGHSCRFLKRVLASRRVVVGAALLAITLPCVGCGKGGAARVPVHPVAGAVKFRGQAMNGAFVALHPKNPTDGVPAPRASVAPDGTFTLSTHDGNDGAPEGEYVVTVQWYKPVKVGKDVVGGPNVLPPKYASASTSDLKITVAAGENHLKPILLR